jgi:hypothetical protein
MNRYRAHKGKHQIGKSGTKGIVYLLHFKHKHFHARHYLGFTTRQLDTRLGEHWSGNGSALTSAIHEQAGNEMILVRTWPPEAAEGSVPEEKQVDQSVEMTLKCRAESPQLCPVCNPEGWHKLAAKYGGQS